METLRSTLLRANQCACTNTSKIFDHVLRFLALKIRSLQLLCPLATGGGGALSFSLAANEESHIHELQPAFVLFLSTLIAVLEYSWDQSVFWPPCFLLDAHQVTYMQLAITQHLI